MMDSTTIVSQQTSLYSDLKEFEEELRAIRRLLKTLHYSISPDLVTHSILNIAMQVVPYEACMIFTWNPLHGNYEMSEMRNVDEALQHEVSDYIKDGLFSWVTREKKPVFLPYDKRLEKEFLVLVPMMKGDSQIGVIVILTSEECTPRHSELLSMLADESAIVLENLKLFGEVVRTKNYLTSIFAYMIDGVITIDSEDIIQMFSERAQRILKITQNQKGKRIHDVFSGTVLEEFLSLKKRVLQKGRLINHEIKFTTFEKIIIPLNVNISVLYDELNNLLGFIYVITDVSESKELVELKKLDELKTGFLNNVSHELKTPLTSMKWAIDLLREKFDVQSTDENIQKLLNIISSDNERLTQLVSDLLDLSRIEAGKITLEKSSVNVINIIEDCIDQISFMAEKKDIKLHFEKKGYDKLISLDRTKIRQVINNLLSNAIKYSDKKTDIVIQVQLYEKDVQQKFKWRAITGGGVQIKVIDNGIGLPEEDLQNIFDKFYRVSNPIVKNTHGTGLGLSICKSFVELHNGTIWAENNKGAGACFNVLLPL